MEDDEADAPLGEAHDDEPATEEVLETPVAEEVRSAADASLADESAMSDLDLASAQLKLCRDAYGDQFVGYALNSAGADLAVLEMTDGRRGALDLMSQFGEVVLKQTNEEAKHFVRQNVLTAAPPTYDWTFPVLFHLWSGGKFPEIPKDESVESYLVYCVHLAYPMALLPPRSERFGLDGIATSIAWRAVRRLMVAILRDIELAQLFPGAPDPEGLNVDELGDFVGIDSKVLWLSNEGMHLGLTNVASSLITYVQRVAALKSDFSAAGLVQTAAEAVRLARRLARRRRAKLPVVCGVSGVALADGIDEIDMGDAKLLRTGPGAVEWLGKPLSGRAHFEVVLIVNADQQILTLERTDQRQPSDQIDLMDGPFATTQVVREDAWEDLQRALVRARYSVLLADDASGMPIPPTIEVTARMNPLCNSHSMSSISEPASSEQLIDHQMAERIRTWSELVHNQHPQSLDVGARRLLSAATRHDPVDGFIDAVLCWENLFGEAGDTALKVCGAMAALLEPDDLATRSETFKTLKNLYAERSKIVHGHHRMPNFRKQVEFRNDAVRFALASMRAAYGVDGLLALSSPERHLRMLGLRQ